MRSFPPMVALVCLIGLAAPTAAQTPGDSIDALTPGRRAYSLTTHDLKNGGPAAIGIWRVVAPNRARGLVLDVSAGVTHQRFGPDSLPAFSTTESHLALALGPRFRRYIAPSRPVAPFVESGFDVGVGFTRGSGSGHPTIVAPGVGAAIGAGAEWFLLRRVSVAAQAGLRGDIHYDHVSASHDRQDTWAVSVGTFISALTLQLYF